ncbi:VOC family protein [Hydrocarboniphaga sp.]|uniref:VOC family protein n=1 Tax=Hydrocarboniphaga sp. TaxID=2033016 RepID=UPI003D098C58
MIKGIHHVAVHVRDMDRMVSFYKQAFGFDVVGEPFEWSDSEFIDRIVDVPNSAARGAMLRAGNCYMEMFQYSAPQPVAPGPLQPYDRGYTHFCVDATDIEFEVERLRGLGMSFSQPGPIDVGHVKSIYGRDPEGNLIEIQQTAEHCDFRMDKLPKRPA